MYKGIVLLVTGTRKPLTREGKRIIEHQLVAHGARLILVGDCPTGVDAVVRDICDRRHQIGIRRFFADWYPNGTRVLDKSAGPRRNQEMVNYAVELEAGGFGDRVSVLGFPSRGSVGTFDCMRRASKAGLVVTETDVSAYVAKNGGGR